MPNPSLSNFPAPTPAWKDVARVCRRICILRERGQLDDAEQLRVTELSALLATCKTESSEQEISTRLDAVFAAEEERVATAATIAELLLPRLASELRSVAGTTERTAPATVGNSDTDLTPSPSVARAAPTDIAGFIDQMFAEDDRAAEPAPSLRRRAS